MPKSTKRSNTKLHCQFCGCKRKMIQFLAIDKEIIGRLSDESGEEIKKHIIPFSVKKFLDLIQSDTMVKLPKFYVGTCGVCLGSTYYKGQNRSTKLEVVTI